MSGEGVMWGALGEGRGVVSICLLGPPCGAGEVQVDGRPVPIAGERVSICVSQRALGPGGAVD